MKLKPVIASLAVLGLMTPAFAHSEKNVASQQAVVNQNSVISTVFSKDWLDRITIGGIGSIVGVYGNHDFAGSFTNTGSGSDLFVNNANLLFNAKLSDWSKATINLAYVGAPDEWQIISSDGHGAIVWDSKDVKYRHSNKIFADEAYVTFCNFAKCQFFVKAGKTYVPFGEYNDQYVQWQIKSPAQLMAQTNAPALIAGVATDFNLYASVFALKGATKPLDTDSNRIRNFGGKIGYHDNLSKFDSPNTHINVNLSYINNLWDSLGMVPAVLSNAGFLGEYNSGDVAKRDQVPGIAAHIDITYKDFNLYGNMTRAMKDLHKAYPTAMATFYGFGDANISSKLWGADVGASYAFETLAHDSSLGAAVQLSGNGQWMEDYGVTKADNADSTASGEGFFGYVLPKWRGVAEYKVNLYKHTDLSLVYAYARSYDNVTKNDEKARSSNLGLARLAVRF